jgi:hypothetical protein
VIPHLGDGLAKRTMVGLSVAVVVFSAAAVPIASPAGADGIGSARAQVAELQQQMTTAGARIRALTVSYEQASTQAASLAQQAAADRAELDRLQGVAASMASALRADAILSYTGGAGGTAAGTAGSADPAVRMEYIEVAAGNLSDAVDQYRAQEVQVASAEKALDADLTAAGAALRAAATARQEAIAEATTVQSQLVSVQNRIQQLEAAQAAEAAARAAAPTQGLPVGGGLVAAVRSVVAPAPSAGGVWLQLRECESGNNYRADTGNGFYGAYQFTQQTWTNLGYPGRPDLEPPAMQDQAAQRLQAQSGWGQWPACSAALGLS